MPRYVLITTLACMGAACGSDHDGITQPTPSVLVHNTLNPPGDRASRRLSLSDLQIRPPGSLGFVPHEAHDDFTSAVTTAIRTVSWQGGVLRAGDRGAGAAVRHGAFFSARLP